MGDSGDPGAPVTTDTLLLASFLRFPPGSVVIDLGCGSGGAMRAAAGHSPGCRWIGIDIRPSPLKAMLRQDRERNEPRGFLGVCCPVEDVPMVFPGSLADAVISNPPFGIANRGRTSPLRARAISRSGPDMLLYRFIRAAAHLLVEGGSLAIAGRPSILPGMLLGSGTWGLGPSVLQPVGLRDSPAGHILLSFVKGVGVEFIIHPQRTAEEIIRQP